MGSGEGGFMKTIPWFRNAAFALLCVCAFFAMPATGQEFPVATRTLKNGMKVLVQTDHSIPNIALYIFYRVGARNEGPGTTGISHFFEHMMFNGAKKYGPGELDKVMEANGGGPKSHHPKNRNPESDCCSGSAPPPVSSSRTSTMTARQRDV